MINPVNYREGMEEAVQGSGLQPDQVLEIQQTLDTWKPVLELAWDEYVKAHAAFRYNHLDHLESRYKAAVEDCDNAVAAVIESYL